MKRLESQKDSYTLKDLEKLYEEASKELRRDCWDRVAKRVKTQNIQATYLGVAKNGDILFKTTSGTTKGKFWHQTLRFKDLNEGMQILYDDISLTRRDIISLLINGDLMVFCDDHSFKYYWSYKAWVRGYGIKKEVRYPKIRNKNLTGSVCKHLYAVLQVLPFYTNQIVADYKKIGLFPKDWEKNRRAYLRKRGKK